MIPLGPALFPASAHDLCDLDAKNGRAGWVALWVTFLGLCQASSQLPCFPGL